MSKEINYLKLNRIIKYVKKEFVSASSQYKAFSSAHEGMAILREEVDELWDGVKLKQSNPKRNKIIRDEAAQVAAMAIRMLYDHESETK